VVDHPENAQEQKLENIFKDDLISIPKDNMPPHLSLPHEIEETKEEEEDIDPEEKTQEQKAEDVFRDHPELAPKTTGMGEPVNLSKLEEQSENSPKMIFNVQSPPKNRTPQNEKKMTIAQELISFSGLELDQEEGDNKIEPEDSVPVDIEEDHILPDDEMKIPDSGSQEDVGIPPSIEIDHHGSIKEEPLEDKVIVEDDYRVHKEQKSKKDILMIPNTFKPTPSDAHPIESINFRNLKFAPVNEQGVVYLFGMVSHQLGFKIENIRSVFPDCEGKRCTDSEKDTWEDVRIEFEYKSSDFKKHSLNNDECDIIICWIHDWEESPIEVLELRPTLQSLKDLYDK
jgi:hypothetical protein